MNGTDELGALLRAWRGRLQPSDVGSPFGDHSTRTPGLRREEVAWLAGVSADYVKRIEQGRARPTADVVRALARALRASDDETAVALRVAGHTGDVRALVPRTITPSVRRLLDRLDDTPVGVFDATWTRLDHNAPWAALTGDGTNTGEPAMNDNLVWRHFLGDGDR
ncbi:MAG: helix-turn-helix domain-containing protein, partial [Corynebacterium sp.]